MSTNTSDEELAELIEADQDDAERETEDILLADEDGEETEVSLDALADRKAHDEDGVAGEDDYGDGDDEEL
jgi:hypothetical protein